MAPLQSVYLVFMSCGLPERFTVAHITCRDLLGALRIEATNELVIDLDHLETCIQDGRMAKALQVSFGV